MRLDGEVTDIPDEEPQKSQMMSQHRTTVPAEDHPEPLKLLVDTILFNAGHDSHLQELPPRLSLYIAFNYRCRFSEILIFETPPKPTSPFHNSPCPPTVSSHYQEAS